MPAPKDPVKYAEWKKKLSDAHGGSVDRNCANCGVVVTVRTSYSIRNKNSFCSPKCYQEYRTGKKIPEGTKSRNKVMRSFICKNCGTENHRQGRGWHGQTFCNLDCAREYLRGENITRYNKAKLICPICNVEYLVKQCDKDKIKTCGNKICRGRFISLTRRGENCPSWKGGATPIARALRMCAKMKEWRDAVFQRDEYKDWYSGCKGDLEAHHIIRVSYLIQKYHITSIEDAEACPELWDVNNGITLLKTSHKFIHDCWG